jgi:hypothetical protein
MTIRGELSPYRAVIIYEQSGKSGVANRWHGWNCSPSNKPGGQDAAYYQDKRHKLLQSGLVFVELDYLHESPPTFDRIPRYGGRDRTYPPEPGSNPYRIVVLDPRPGLIEGQAYPGQFGVDEPMPTMKVPLNADDVLTFDFDAPYQRTYEELLYGLELVDYSQLPLNFDRYSPEDRARIAARMLAVVRAARAGISLENSAPLPVEPSAVEKPRIHT